jgi:hypothetical protein
MRPRYETWPPTVAEYCHELIAHFIHLDGKILRTLGTLFFVPGKLPNDYLANKRARYVRPLKLYFAMIAIAFTVVEFLGWDLGLHFGGLRFNFFHVPRTAQDWSSADTVPLVLEYIDTPSIRHFKALSPEEQLKLTRERGIRYLPYLAIGLVPIYAVLLQWVYRTRHWRYGAHLVFSLYAHSFLLLIFVIESKLPLALATIFSSWSIVYYPLALKRVYGGTWSETIGRGALLAILYCLTFLMLGVLATTLLLSI